MWSMAGSVAAAAPSVNDFHEDTMDDQAARTGSTILLFHHAQGQTQGFLAFADWLRAAGYAVHAPDLFEGRTFATVEDGVANAQKVGFGEIIRRGVASAGSLPKDI